jgi:2',5'-phosphodiesterase
VFAAVLAGEEGGGGSDAGGPAALALAARHGGLLPVLRSSAWLRDALAKVSTVAQVALLAPKAEGGGGGGGGGGGDPPPDLDAPLVVTNTHLFFHPAAPHIRTLHVAAMLTEAADVAARAVAAGRVGEPPVPLFCGDLNSDLNDGVPGAVELLREGVLSSGFWDWRLGAAFRYDRDGVADAEPGSPLPPPDPAAPGDGLAPVDLALPFRLAPADGLATPFTTWVRGYGGLLDYVWTDDRALAPVGGPPPPCHLLGPDTFLPSATFPSDHLAVVADLEFRPPAARAAPRRCRAPARAPASAPS